MPPLAHRDTAGSRSASIDPVAPATLRVVTWNLAHWMKIPPIRAAAWEYLADELATRCDWDVALLQECRPPDDWPHPTIWRPLGALDWGTAITVRSDGPAGAESLRAITLEDDSHPGAVVAGRVELAAGADGAPRAATLVSVYGTQEPRKLVDEESRALPTPVMALHRILSDLTPLIDREAGSRPPVPLVLAGDLNVSTQVTGARHRRRHAEVLDRIAGLGLTDGWTVSPDAARADDCSCAAAPGCGHVRTHRHRRSSIPWQLDHIFVSRSARFTSCRTVIDERTWELSDHAPVAAILELS
jgi:hypothetical protein